MLSTTEHQESSTMMLDLQATTPPSSTQLDESDDSDGEPETRVNVEITMDYDIDFPPPKPGPEWTRFICISDTHGGRFRVPEGDVLLHAGDLTRRGKLSELRSTVEWLASLRHPYKIVIAGNHDRALDSNTPVNTLKQSREFDHAAALNLLTSSQARASNIHYLNRETFQIPSVDGRKSWKVYGSPWTPWFRGLSFNYKEDIAQGKLFCLRFIYPQMLICTMSPEIVGNIPPDADIVMTHGPPHGVLDLTRKEGVHAGCPTLLSRIAELKPRLHVFGHIHESRGSRVQRWENQDNLSQLAADLPPSATVFLNAANSPLTSNFGPEASSADGQRIPIGGPGWHPVIVDML